jgi:site-specific DNA-methyltransferase (adenine-specific)
VGFGHWLRGDIDEMWVCTRGNIKPHHIQTPNFLQTRSENQTRKPAEIKDLLAQVAKQANLNPRIELFSRDRTEGWQILGNELPSTTQKNLLEESESQCA